MSVLEDELVRGRQLRRRVELRADQGWLCVIGSSKTARFPGGKAHRNRRRCCRIEELTIERLAMLVQQVNELLDVDEAVPE